MAPCFLDWLFFRSRPPADPDDGPRSKFDFAVGFVFGGCSAHFGDVDRVAAAKAELEMGTERGCVPLHIELLNESCGLVSLFLFPCCIRIAWALPWGSEFRNHC